MNEGIMLKNTALVHFLIIRDHIKNPLLGRVDVYMRIFWENENHEN